MHERDSEQGWGVTGWGYNAREPWAAPRFTARPNPTGGDTAPEGRTALRGLVLLVLLVTASAYACAAHTLF